MSNEHTIVVVDYGLGNIFSLVKALRKYTQNVVVTDDPVQIENASAVVLPGVGAFAAGMKGLEAKGLVSVLQAYAATGKPMLGICLGAQLMLAKGYEFGEHDGLGLVSGTVELFPESVQSTEKIPHVGWNAIYRPKTSDWNDTIFSQTEDKQQVYFVHSYIMIPDDPANICVNARYGDVEFCAAIRSGNIYGAQFHPEKSGEEGLSIIKQFVELTI